MMTGLYNLIRRNSRLFFKDRGAFFSSLISPVILLVLYATFLNGVYRDAFTANIPAGFSLPESVVAALANGQLASSLLAVSCVTVAFCSNMMMVQDKVSGARRDLTVTPVRKSTLALSYYVATLLSSLLICLVAAGICFLYMLKTGWYFSAGDVGLIVLDIFLLVMFGTALSSIVNVFLTTQGQISAVGTVVSSGYGFICGAYMPISQFGAGLQRVLSLLPGTYGTSLIRNHAMQGAFREMRNQHVPDAVIQGIMDSVDCRPACFGHTISIPQMYAIMIATIAVLIAVYVLINKLRRENG